MEFQSRGAPHYHVFLTIDPDPQIQKELAAAWVRIANLTNEAFRFHNHRKNWIPWEMRGGGYVAKYLSKVSQKCVPEGYYDFGRFWGASRGLVPSPGIQSEAEYNEALSMVDMETGEIRQASVLLLRWMGRLADKQTRGWSRFRSRAQEYSYSLLQGAGAFHQISEYLGRLKAAQVPF